MPSLSLPLLTHIQDIFESWFHLIVPLGAHSVFLDSLPFEHVSNVTLNLKGNGVGSVLLHRLHILKIGKLNAWNGFIGCEIINAVSWCQEWFPEVGIINIVINKSWVIEGLNIGPHVF